jgi:UDP-N-acetylmuramoylalanine--D-glutamate ligase
LVVGLARSGAAAARLLVERGEEVRGCDTGRPEEAESLAGTGVEVTLEDDGTGLLEAVRTVIKSPGVADDAAVIVDAQTHGIAVIGELELAWRALPNRFIAVTGTNGKTTTTELIGHLYRTAGLEVAVGGNVGTPLASLVGELDEEATVVCECSSFQLEDTVEFAPECAVFLNFAKDHMDRHATPAHYLAAKLRIFENQSPDDLAVINGGEPALAGADLGTARQVTFCVSEKCDASLDDDAITWRDEALLDIAELPLLGAHNIENAMAAAAAALSMGIETAAVREGLASFPGVPHRLERVAEIDGVSYVNDSKATNVASATVGLRAFDSGVHAILGGSLKGESFNELREPVEERCAACYLIGEAADPIAEALAPLAKKGLPIERCASLDEAVATARRAAKPGEIVLLSPACASFDAFRDFEQRGERFRELVTAS